MRRTLVYALLIVLCWSVFLGASDNKVGLFGSLGGQRVGLSNELSSGSRSAGWDTVTIVFATNVDTNHFYQQHDNDINNATYVVDLDTVDTFAHGLLDSALSTAGYFSTRFQPLESAPRQLINGNSRLDHRLGDGYGDKTMPIFHIPFEDFIPKNSHIVSADVSVYNYSSLYFAGGDTIMATLMNAPADSAWYRNKGISTSPNYAHATWNQQRATTVGGQATGAADVKYWDPPISDRAYYWDMGVDLDWIGDWSGSFYSSPQSAGAGYSFSIRNCVQGAVNGATNNGISVFFAQDDVSARAASFFHWDEDGTSANKSPWVTIKYITKRYSEPFGTSDWAFVFSTDDAQPANSAYTDSFLAHGMRYTLFQSLIQIGSLGRMEMDSITVWHGEGFEYGPHTRGHPTDGVLKWQPADTSAADMDSLYYALASSWVDSLGVAFDGTSRADDPYWAKSMALANNKWSPEALLAIANIGYEAMRSGDIDGYADKAYYELATQGAARTDSIMAGITHHDGRRPRNMVGLPLTITIQELVGAKADTGVTEAEILQNFKRLVYQVRGDGRGVLNTFAHDFKTDPNDANYQEGLDVDECGWMLDAVGALGGRSMRVSEYARWIKQSATPIPTPSAYAQEDTFKFSATDRVWFVPHGIDNTPIRGLRADASAYSYDTDAPTTPSSLLAIAGDGQVVLTWTGATDKSTVTYNVYRFFEGSADTTLIASKVSNTFYADYGAINGTEHFYFVSASDLAENESYDSGIASDTPLGSLSLATPSYYALWYQNPPASSPTAAQYDSLAAFDMVVAGALSLNGDASEPFYAGMKDSLVARNPDIMVLSYAMAVTPRTDWGAYPAGSAQKRTWDFLVGVADSLGFGQNLSGFVVESDAYPTYFTNIMTAAYADTIARYWVDALNGSGMDGAYSGFFVDLADSSLADWICDDGGCTDIMDFDQDATAYASDADEKAAYKAFQLAFTKALRREFAENGMSDRLIVHNGDYARNNASVARYVDGFMFEGWNLYVPGPQGSEAVWEATIAKRDLLVNAQTNPPLVLYDANADSSHAFITEPLSLAYGGLTGVQDAGSDAGISAIPAMVRRLPSPGTISSYDAANDTLVVTATNYTARLDINHSAADTFTVWPYFIVSGTDTISRGGGWPRQAFTQAPIITDTYAYDAQVEILWDEDQLYAVEGYTQSKIYRSASGDTTTLEYFDDPTQIANYTKSATNDSTYYYAVTNVGAAGESYFSDVVALTPSSPASDLYFADLFTSQPARGDTADGDLVQPVDIATLSTAAHIKPMFRRWPGPYSDWTDTSATYWSQSASTDWSGDYDTGIPIAIADSDSGGIRLTWDAGTGQTSYLLQMKANTDDWTTVSSSVNADSTGYTHAADDGVPPRRGELNYRLYGLASGDTSAVALADSLFLNEAIRVYGKFLAKADTAAHDSTIVESEEFTWTYISAPYTGPDVTAPDTTGVFAGVVVDTTNTSNVILRLQDMTINEPGQVQFQWSNNAGVAYHDAEEWSPATPAATVADTIHTGISTAGMNSDLYIRFRLRDDEGTPNESGWVEHQQPFNRRGTGGGYAIFSNSSTLDAASDSASADSYVKTGWDYAGVDAGNPTQVGINSGDYMSGRVSQPPACSTAALREVFLFFDVASTVPAMATIDSVKLSFAVNSAQSYGVLSVATITDASFTVWPDGTANNSSFNEYSPGNSWQSAMASVSDWGDMGTLDEWTSPTAATTYNLTLSTTGVQAWVDGTSDEGGFFVGGWNNSGKPCSYTGYKALNLYHPGSSNGARPVLQVWWSN